VESARPQAASGLDALTARSFYVVRHAKAGDRDQRSGDDRKRPLTRKGLQQAEALVSLLAPYQVSAVFSSPYLRCLQTVEPLARVRRLEIQHSPSLEEGNGLEGLGDFLGDRSLDHAVLSTHGDIVVELIDDLVSREVIQPGYGGDQKGSTWVLEVDEHGVTERAHFIPAP
jgi:8-oxo-dGTP diphosphatase